MRIRPPYATLSIIVFSFSLYFLVSNGDPYIYPISKLALYGVSDVNWLIGGLMYSFAHLGLKHLAANMFVLAILGSVLEQKIKSRDLLLIFILSGFVSGVIYTHIRPDVWVLGASAAICGLIGAGLLVDPKNTLLAAVLGIYAIPIVVYPTVDFVINHVYTSQEKTIVTGIKTIQNYTEKMKNATGEEKKILEKKIKIIYEKVKTAEEKREKLVKGVKTEEYTPTASLLHILGGITGMAYVLAFRRKQILEYWGLHAGKS